MGYLFERLNARQMRIDMIRDKVVPWLSFVAGVAVGAGLLFLVSTCFLR